jgi:hypothetical protein
LISNVIEFKIGRPVPVDDSFTMLDLKLDFFYSLFSVLLLLDIIREFVVSENCISLFLVIFF